MPLHHAFLVLALTATTAAASCMICDDVAPPWANGTACADFTQTNLASKCRNNNNWKNAPYCERTCFVAGVGYDGSACCLTTPSPTPTPHQGSSVFAGFGLASLDENFKADWQAWLAIVGASLVFACVLFCCCTCLCYHYVCKKRGAKGPDLSGLDDAEKGNGRMGKSVHERASIFRATKSNTTERASSKPHHSSSSKKKNNKKVAHNSSSSSSSTKSVDSSTTGSSKLKHGSSKRHSGKKKKHGSRKKIERSGSQRRCARPSCGAMVFAAEAAKDASDKWYCASCLHCEKCNHNLKGEQVRVVPARSGKKEAGKLVCRRCFKEHRVDRSSMIVGDLVQDTSLYSGQMSRAQYESTEKFVADNVDVEGLRPTCMWCGGIFEPTDELESEGTPFAHHKGCTSLGPAPGRTVKVVPKAPRSVALDFAKETKSLTLRLWLVQRKAKVSKKTLTLPKPERQQLVASFFADIKASTLADIEKRGHADRAACDLSFPPRKPRTKHVKLPGGSSPVPKDSGLRLWLEDFTDTNPLHTFNELPAEVEGGTKKPGLRWRKNHSEVEVVLTRLQQGVEESMTVTFHIAEDKKKKKKKKEKKPTRPKSVPASPTSGGGVAGAKNDGEEDGKKKKKKTTTKDRAKSGGSSKHLSIETWSSFSVELKSVDMHFVEQQTATG